jgi:hypothetical protein
LPVGAQLDAMIPDVHLFDDAEADHSKYERQ